MFLMGTVTGNPRFRFLKSQPQAVEHFTCRRVQDAAQVHKLLAKARPRETPRGKGWLHRLSQISKSQVELVVSFACCNLLFMGMMKPVD